MRGTVFCYFHGRTHLPVKPARVHEARLDFPAVLDRAGIQEALSQIMQALAAGTISSRRASILVQGIQHALVAGFDSAMPPFQAPSC